MKTVSLLLLLVLIGTITGSCSNSSSPASTNGELSESPYAEAKKVSVHADSLTDFAQQIPGFGGLFINDSDQLSIYLTNPTQQEAKAREVLSNSELIARSLSNSSASVSNMEVLKGQYTFLTLLEWKREVSSKVLAMDNVYTGGIHQSQNKLSIGVKDETVAAKVNEKLAELDIPKEAVMMYQMTPPQYY
ncbi:hypothetical protein [Fodinibius salsisoli]|uniref:Uncharacterized protein n=1 Tax=Fodinibius salsisoli TaxID=2820877 RepID=A0ABT3PPS0_9BACT|nr:hypothetical protein [Fodinibius salsisoli]MCW9707853.1 hypothetical protein [Fodinibius salsisoli]